MKLKGEGIVRVCGGEIEWMEGGRMIVMVMN